MATVDQAPRGLLVPAWKTAADGRRMAVAVISEEGGDWAGLTVKEAAERAGVDIGPAKDHLEAGYLPGQKPRHRQSGPRSGRSVAWRQKYLPRELWALPAKECAEKIGISESRMNYCIARDLAPTEERRATGARSSKARRWVQRFVPKSLQAAPISAIASHYGVSQATLHSWIRRGFEPKAGGYRTGKRPASPKKKAQKAARELAPLLKKAQKNPLAFIMGAS